MSSIEWTDKTWNPVTGCNKVSEGCANCYAESVAKRFWGDRKFGDVQFHPERLEQPLKWRKPRWVFVNSMSDLWHESVTDEQLDQVFAVMALTPQHTYQVLTKRPERMLEYFSGAGHRCYEPTPERVRQAAFDISGEDLHQKCDSDGFWPLKNCWLGVTCENQRTADERIPLLLQTPAAVRFLSCEPLLEKVDLDGIETTETTINALTGAESWMLDLQPGEAGQMYEKGVDWVIAGGESGSKARPCDIAWIRSIVEQCKAANVPCFVKQLGAYPIGHDGETSVIGKRATPFGGGAWRRLESGKGNDPSEWPADLRVREYPHEVFHV